MRQSMALLIALAARPARALIPRLHRVPRAAVVRSMTEAPVNLVVDPETGEEMSKSALKKLQKQRKIDAKKAAKKQKAAEAAPASSSSRRYLPSTTRPICSPRSSAVMSLRSTVVA